jgi:hypothetical protein
MQVILNVQYFKVEKKGRQPHCTGVVQVVYVSRGLPQNLFFITFISAELLGLHPAGRTLSGLCSPKLESLGLSRELGRTPALLCEGLLVGVDSESVSELSVLSEISRLRTTALISSSKCTLCPCVRSSSESLWRSSTCCSVSSRELICDEPSESLSFSSACSVRYCSEANTSLCISDIRWRASSPASGDTSNESSPLD